MGLKSESKTQTSEQPNVPGSVFVSLFIIFFCLFVYLFIVLENRRLSYFIFTQAQEYKNISRRYKYESLQYDQWLAPSLQQKQDTHVSLHQKVIFLNDEYVIVEEL